MSGTAQPAREIAKTLAQSAYEALRVLILSGELKPGERLVERELARKRRLSDAGDAREV